MRKLYLLVVNLVVGFLFSSALAFGQGSTAAAVPVTVNQSGAPLPSTLVTVCTTFPGTGNCAVRVPTFTDNTLGTACSGTLQSLNNLLSPSIGSGCSNPGYSDGLGNVLVFAAAGFYWCQYAGPTLTTYSQPCMFPSASGGGGLAFNLLTSGTNISAIMGVGQAASIAPSGAGQIAGTQLWIPAGLVAPSMSFATTGGSFLNGRQTSIRYILNSALGSTTPSISQNGSNGTFGCSTSTCQLTITKPTLPAGYTSYSVYAQDCGAAPCGGAEVLQAACTVITINCVLNTVGAGAALPTANTAVVQPTNLQSYTTDCPPGVIPSIFTPDVNGNYRAWVGMNMGDTLPSQTAGTPTICYRTYFRDDVSSNPSFSAQTQSFKNAFVSINHLAGKFTSPTIQDRGLAVNLYNPAGDSGTYYAWEGIQSEVDVVGTPTFNGSPDGEVSAGSFQLSIANTNTIGYGTLGPNAIRAQAFRGSTNGGAASCTYCLYGVHAIVSNQSANAYNGGMIVGVSGETNNSATGSGISGIAVLAKAPIGRLVGSNFGFYVENHGTNALDWNIFSQSLAGTPTNGRNWFGGNVYLPNIITAANDIGVTGSLVASGSLSAAQFATPAFSNGSITAQGVSGATSYSYKLTAVDGNGKESAASVTGTIAAGNATLTGSNFNRITLTSGFVIGVGHFNVYRTASGGTPSSTGKIGQFTITVSTLGGVGILFDDTGLAGDGTVPPTANTTGGVNAGGYVTAGLNTVRVASNFTTAANTSLQTITGLSWNIPNGAGNYSFHCALGYSQATANAAVAFGIQAATIAPTNIFATGTEQITAGPPATVVTGTLLTLNTTTATNIVSGTPGATATNYTTYLDGTLEEPAGTGNVLNIMVSTATSGDAVTVLRGSYCSIQP